METRSQQNGATNAHNQRRKLHCVPPLTWSNQLAQSAQSYANMCILDKHGSTGENMADSWSEINGHPVLPASTDRRAFENTWYCENKNYDFVNPTFKGGFTSNCQNVNGHFTQVVWKDTRELGCRRATCTINGHQRTHWVCRYAPLATSILRMYLFYSKKSSVRNATGDVTFLRRS